MALPIDRCHWLRTDRDEDVMVPMCMGCAVYGPLACTCATPFSLIERAEQARDIAIAEVDRLREKLHRQPDHYLETFQMNKALRARLSKLETPND